MLKCSSMAAAVRPASARRPLIRASAASAEPLAGRGGAGKQGLDLAQPCTQLLLGRHAARLPPDRFEVLAPQAHPGQFDRR